MLEHLVFIQVKNLGACGEGGAITTNNKKLDKKVKEVAKLVSAQKILS